METLGEIDSTLLSEEKSLRRKRPWLAAAAVAAALVLAFGVTLLIGAARRPELPVFYSVNGSLYRRATSAGAIFIEMLPSSCHGEKVGEATPVEITEGTEATKAPAEPQAIAAPHATKAPAEPVETEAPLGWTSAWSAQGGDCSIVVICGGTYVKADFGEVLNAKGFAEDEAVSIRDGSYVIAEGETAKDIYRRLWKAAPITMYSMSVPGLNEQVALMLTVGASEEELRNIHDIMDIHTLVIQNGEGNGVCVDYLAKANCLVYKGSLFVLTEEDSAALRALLGVG